MFYICLQHARGMRQHKNPDIDLPHKPVYQHMLFIINAWKSQQSQQTILEFKQKKNPNHIVSMQYMWLYKNINQ